MRAIGIARQWGARTWGFYCTHFLINRNQIDPNMKESATNKQSPIWITEQRLKKRANSQGVLLIVLPLSDTLLQLSTKNSLNRNEKYTYFLQLIALG